MLVVQIGVWGKTIRQHHLASHQIQSSVLPFTAGQAMVVGLPIQSLVELLGSAEISGDLYQVLRHSQPQG